MNKPGCYTQFCLYKYKERFANHYNFQDTDLILAVPEATQNGITYKLGDVLLHSKDSKVAFDVISDIAIIGNDAYCITHKCEIEYFDSHRNRYVAKKICETDVLKPSDLPLPWPQLQCLCTNGSLFVVPMCLPDVEEFL